MAELPFVERIAVVGGGTVALLAAVAIARAMPRSTVVQIPCPVPEAAMADHAVSGGLALQALHARIGIADALLLARAGGSHWLATRYRGFAGQADFLVGHGAAARDAAGGFAAEPSLAALLAASERLPALEAAGDDAVDPMLRFAPAAYREGLALLAGQAGVRRSPPAVGPASEGGVLLADGSVLDADLLVDATGSGWLRAAHAPAAWIAWKDPGELDRCARLEAPATRLPSLCDTIWAREAGYLIEQPGSGGTAWTALWAGGEADAVMLGLLAAASGETPGAPFAMRAGRLAAPWQGRVVAIGDAAAQLAPLGNPNLALAASQILLLLDLLPGGRAPFAEAGEYNRRAALLADDARDFVRCQQGAAGSHRLAQRVDQFRRRGWVPELAEGLIPADHWAQLLTGLGCGPGALPRALAMSAESREALADERRRRRVEQVARAPRYEAWLTAREHHPGR